MTQIAVNGTELYYELRGQGPPVVFITGATGDAQWWADSAEALADEFTVLTYDRRGNSRSARPTSATHAPLSDNADDAAALLNQLRLAPAVAYGSSSGAIYLTDLLIRHVDVVNGAVLHEPPFIPVTSDPAAVADALGTVIGAGMEQGGPRAAMEAFLRLVVGDEVYSSYDPEARNRVLANGEVFFGAEMPALQAYMPSTEQLAQVRVPCVVSSGIDNQPLEAAGHWFYEASSWLAEALSVELTASPGAHVPMASHPDLFVTWVRPILRSLSAPPV